MPHFTFPSVHLKHRFACPLDLGHEIRKAAEIAYIRQGEPLATNNSNAEKASISCLFWHRAHGPAALIDWRSYAACGSAL